MITRTKKHIHFWNFFYKFIRIPCRKATHYDDFFVPFHEMGQFDVTIGLTIPLPGKNSGEILFLDFSLFGKFFEEFPHYIKKARSKLSSESKPFFDPRLRILKPLIYYSLESLILK